jgi:uncharacterized membrane protein
MTVNAQFESAQLGSFSEKRLAAKHRLAIGRACARWTLAVIYLTAGIFHVWTPETFLLITPDWVPFPKQVIFSTGLCEIAGAFALFTQRLRYAAGIAFALYAICVYPANIKHAFYGLPLDHAQLTWWYHAPRLAFQPVLVWWALFAGEVTTWPFNRQREVEHPASIMAPTILENAPRHEKSLHHGEPR